MWSPLTSRAPDGSARTDAARRVATGVSVIGRLAASVLDLVLPARCLGCGEAVQGFDTLCAGCWRELRFLSDPICRRCGFPLAHEVPVDALCGRCVNFALPIDRIRAALAYDAASSRLILSYKHGHRLASARLFATWMSSAGADLIAAADIIVPVPLHRLRLWRRGFNQAALIAGALAPSARAAYLPDLLVRWRSTGTQRGRTGRQRMASVRASSFAVSRARHASLQKARVLLVDDVLTTGATLAACADTLLLAGADAVDALVVARVVQPRPVPI